MALGPKHARDGLGFSSHKQDKSKESYTVDPNGETLKSVKNIKDRRYYNMVQSIMERSYSQTGQ